MCDKVLYVSSMAACLIFASGCGSNAPANMYAARGNVYLDEEPLETGNITFFPDGRGSVISGGTIEDGKFYIPKHQGLAAGTYRVSITASVTAEPISTNPNELMENPPEVISLIPKCYNSETTLTAEIENADVNFFAFNLQSK